MKKIIFILLLIPALAKSQADSSQTTISVTLQRRDLGYLLNLTGHLPIFEDLDSVIKTKYRPTPPATPTTNVTIAGIKVRAWYSILLMLTYDPYATNSLILSRITTACQVPANVWLNHKIDVVTNLFAAEIQARITAGEARGQKQLDTQILQ